MLYASFPGDSTDEEAGPALSWWGHLPIDRGLWEAGMRGFVSKMAEVKAVVGPCLFMLYELFLKTSINIFLPCVGLRKEPLACKTQRSTDGLFILKNISVGLILGELPPSGKTRMARKQQYRWRVKCGSKGEFEDQAADAQILAVSKP